MKAYDEFKNDIIKQFKINCETKNISQKSELPISTECAEALMKEYPYNVSKEGWRLYLYHSNIFVLTPDGNDVHLSTWDDIYVLEFIEYFCEN